MLRSWFISAKPASFTLNLPSPPLPAPYLNCRASAPCDGNTNHLDLALQWECTCVCERSKKKRDLPIVILLLLSKTPQGTFNSSVYLAVCVNVSQKLFVYPLKDVFYAIARQLWSWVEKIYLLDPLIYKIRRIFIGRGNIWMPHCWPHEGPVLG